MTADPRELIAAERRRGQAERIAPAFHEAYERLAPAHGYETREESRKAWLDVPEQNRALMVAVVEDLLARGLIAEPPAVEWTANPITATNPTPPGLMRDAWPD